jgi:hypothetical protein
MNYLRRIWWERHVARITDMRYAYKVSVKHVTGRDQLENLCANGTIILKLMSKKYARRGD